MKKILPAFLFVLLCQGVFGQTNYTGSYGYSFKPEGNPPKAEANRGPSGNLVLIRMDGNKYRFWLDVTNGWPTYNVGETDGTITFVNDTASFDNTFESATNLCILRFRYTNGTITIQSASASYNCGFGNNVHADGQFTRLKIQPALNNDWLKKEYGQAPPAVVTADKAEIFQDEECTRPFSPRKYFVKGDHILAIALSPSDKSIYTEYIPSPDKFVYGWLRKSDLHMNN